MGLPNLIIAPDGITICQASQTRFDKSTGDYFDKIGRGVAIVSGLGIRDRAQQEAFARAFAAAPEMLAAHRQNLADLEAICFAMFGPHEPDADDGAKWAETVFWPMLERTRAAIAKAEGRADG